MDEKYDNCYSLIDLKRDRTYCELKFTRETETKFACAYCLVSDERVADDLAALDLCIESTDQNTELSGIGGDYCAYKYPYDASYAQKYQCLATEGIEKTAESCQAAYDYQYYQATVLEGAGPDSAAVAAL